MRGTIRQRAPRWIAALICGFMLLDVGCLQSPTFPTINPPKPHGMRAPDGAAPRAQTSAPVVIIRGQP